MEPAGASKVFFNHDGLLEVQPSDTIHLSGSMMHIDPVLVDDGGDMVIVQQAALEFYKGLFMSSGANGYGYGV
ncbi:hypothetical protein V6N12_028821 [Hibiscus sabdariffa]|uniref:Uncharacterized protein n=1 Tax=Hibiscus sabdariffa TaxID=183260 RepID=A0ABR2F6Z6_9ROSI